MHWSLESLYFSLCLSSFLLWISKSLGALAAAPQTEECHPGEACSPERVYFLARLPAAYLGHLVLLLLCLSGLVVAELALLSTDSRSFSQLRPLDACLQELFIF